LLKAIERDIVYDFGGESLRWSTTHAANARPANRAGAAPRRRPRSGENRMSGASWHPTKGSTITGTTHESTAPDGATGHKRLMLAIGILLVVYIAATVMGWTIPAPSGPTAHAAAEAHHDGHGGAHAEHALPSYFAVIPFVLLLAAIAVLPLLHATEHWWESNLHRFYLAAGLALVTLAYYVLAHGAAEAGTVLKHALLDEYIPFIVLLFSLYTISGGIRIAGDLPAHPTTNAAFLAVGGLMASFIGTTGAAMLLIRPLLETNVERKRVQHTIIFFIFVVCNCGGCLLPIGDPPLFLGYLRGVDFLWTATALWFPWLVVNVILIAVYWVWDKFFCYPYEEARDIRRDETRVHRLRFSGLWPNVPLLAGVVFSVALLDPSKTFPGTDWQPWLYLREIVQIGLVALSLAWGSMSARQANRFNFGAIIEVAALFVGIFICMQPALQILDEKGPSLGITTPFQFFWITGALSSVLDNAPTYVVFFETANALFPAMGLAELIRGSSEAAEKANEMLVGISLGAVFMGAMTYIGNGPNFMVRAIAEQSGVKMPSFFGYVLWYSVPVLIPIFLVVTLLLL
jgi:Na+/H+ antiporter NhaD/arsenite permease-like protein